MMTGFVQRVAVVAVAFVCLTACATDDGKRAPWLCQIGENLCKQRCEPMRAEQAIECRRSCERECNR
jgi:hypothetical protein